jgi:hypothetical protein
VAIQGKKESNGPIDPASNADHIIMQNIELELTWDGDVASSPVSAARVGHYVRCGKSAVDTGSTADADGERGPDSGFLHRGTMLL